MAIGVSCFVSLQEAVTCSAGQTLARADLLLLPPPTLHQWAANCTCAQRVSDQRHRQPLGVQRAQQRPELAAQEQRCPAHAAVAVACQVAVLLLCRITVAMIKVGACLHMCILGRGGECIHLGKAPTVGIVKVST